jgi:RimJ/RimL family protein N-acetyltransferase
LADPEQRDDPAPVLNIVGRTVALGPMTRELIPTYHRWVNDFMVESYGGAVARPATLDAVETEVERLTRAHDRVHFTIFEQPTLRAIGWVNLRDIELEHRTATLGISINEATLWGRGYGTEATTLIVDYGFNVLGIHNIMLDTFSSNERAIHVYRKVGFREVGRRRESYRIGAKVFDIVLMEILSTEFKSAFPPVLPSP